jgi:hypothetical protein
VLFPANSTHPPLSPLSGKYITGIFPRKNQGVHTWRHTRAPAHHRSSHHHRPRRRRAPPAQCSYRTRRRAPRRPFLVAENLFALEGFLQLLLLGKEINGSVETTRTARLGKPVFEEKSVRRNPNKNVPLTATDLFLSEDFFWRDYSRVSQECLSVESQCWLLEHRGGQRNPWRLGVKTRAGA